MHECNIFLAWVLSFQVSLIVKNTITMSDTEDYAQEEVRDIIILVVTTRMNQSL